jgi:methylated-DNA-[protein]-cysteine S-methyltransferase
MRPSAPIEPEALVSRTVPSPVGTLVAVASAQGLRAVLWPDDRPARAGLAAVPPAGESPVLDAFAAQLAEYVAGTRQVFDVPLDLRGTPFQLAVWEALRGVGFGSTVSYGELAAALGRPTAARAVGAAVGRNPVSIVVPCHRVVGADGSMTGFAGGLDAKRTLLHLERGHP